MRKLIFILILIGLLAAATELYVSSRRHATTPKQAAQKAPEAKITLIEGWSNDTIAAYLDCAPDSGFKNCQHLVSASTFANAEMHFNTSNYPLLDSKPATADLEGFIFPDTYLVAHDASSTEATIAQAVIKRALDNFSKKFTPEMKAQADAGHMTVYDVVTLASIIEKETGRNAVTDEQRQKLDVERKIIAGIFYNRLNIGMALQSDATVNYVTKKSVPSASTEDLKVESPYNTYLHKGLPPGPIANPSLSSIMAALYPTKTNYFYFLHDQTTGEAVYAVTFEEHIQNKYKYLK